MMVAMLIFINQGLLVFYFWSSIPWTKRQVGSTCSINVYWIHEQMNEHMKEYTVWRTQTNYQTEVYSLHFFQGDCQSPHLCPMLSFMRFCRIHFLAKYFQYLLCVMPFGIYFFMSLWVASPIRCFSACAPFFHHSKSETYSFFSNYVLSTSHIPDTAVCGKDTMANDTDANTATTHSSPNRERVLYYSLSHFSLKGVKKNWKSDQS